MERSDLLELFRSTAEEIAEKDFSHVHEEMPIAELGIDSLGMLELVGAMERELQIRVPDEDLAGIQNIRQLLDLIQSKQSAS